MENFSCGKLIDFNNGISVKKKQLGTFYRSSSFQTRINDDMLH